jgi:predicted nucleotidyltransferase
MDYTKNNLVKLLTPFLMKFGVKLSYFFGSAARGKMGPLSDIDIAVLWPKSVNAPMIMSLKLQQEIKTALKEDKFEIGSLNGQSLSFRYVVISTGNCIYGTKEDQVSYETETLSQYLDFNYLAEEYNRAFDQKMRAGYNGKS